MKKASLTYEEALQRLEGIVKDIEQGELGIDELTKHIAEAQQLLEYCQDKLTRVDNEIKQMFDHEQK